MNSECTGSFTFPSWNATQIAPRVGVPEEALDRADRRLHEEAPVLDNAGAAQIVLTPGHLRAIEEGSAKLVRNMSGIGSTGTCERGAVPVVYRGIAVLRALVV